MTDRRQATARVSIRARLPRAAQSTLALLSLSKDRSGPRRPLRPADGGARRLLTLSPTPPGPLRRRPNSPLPHAPYRQRQLAPPPGISPTPARTPPQRFPNSLPQSPQNAPLPSLHSFPGNAAIPCPRALRARFPFRRRTDSHRRTPQVTSALRLTSGCRKRPARASPGASPPARFPPTPPCLHAPASPFLPARPAGALSFCRRTDSQGCPQFPARAPCGRALLAGARSPTVAHRRLLAD